MDKFYIPNDMLVGLGQISHIIDKKFNRAINNMELYQNLYPSTI